MQTVSLPVAVAPEIPPPGEEGYIFVKEYTNRWGQRMKAEDYGKQAFRIPIRNRKCKNK